MFLRFIDGTADNSEQLLDNVNRTHLVLACGKLLRQKKTINFGLVTSLDEKRAKEPSFYDAPIL